jgi:chromate transporter
MSVTFSRQKEVFTSAVLGPIDMASVLVGLFALRVIKIPIMLLVACFMVFGYAIAL